MWGKAARSILEEIWLTLECGKNDAARFILYNLSNEIKEATNDEQVMNMFQVAEKALEILGHPLGALPDPGISTVWRCKRPIASIGSCRGNCISQW